MMSLLFKIGSLPPESVDLINLGTFEYLSVPRLSINAHNIKHVIFALARSLHKKTILIVMVI